MKTESNHPLAQAIVQYTETKFQLNLFSPEQLEDVAGWGIKAYINDEEWLIGKADFVGTLKPISLQME